MCLYMSVPKWLNLQKFLKAINESINHTIDVTFMFIYFKCLNNSSTKNQQHPATKTLAKQIVATQTINLDKNHKIDFNVNNFKKINTFEKFTLHKTCSEIGQTERIITTQQQQQHNNYNLLQLNPQQQHLPQQQQQHLHHQSLCNTEQLLLMDKFKTFPLHI